MECRSVTVSPPRGLSLPLPLVAVLHIKLPASADLMQITDLALAGIAERVTVVEMMSAGAGLLLASLIANGN